MSETAAIAYGGHVLVPSMRELSPSEVDLVAGGWSWSDFFQEVSTAVVGAATGYGVANAFGPAGTLTWTGVIFGAAASATSMYITYNTWESIENMTPGQMVGVIQTVGVPLTPYDAISQWASWLLGS